MPRRVGAHGDINQPAEGDSQLGDGRGINDVAGTEQPLGFISILFLQAAGAARHSSCTQIAGPDISICTLHSPPTLILRRPGGEKKRRRRGWTEDLWLMFLSQLNILTFDLQPSSPDDVFWSSGCGGGTNIFSLLLLNNVH